MIISVSFGDQDDTTSLDLTCGIGGDRDDNASLDLTCEMTTQA